MLKRISFIIFLVHIAIPTFANEIEQMLEDLSIIENNPQLLQQALEFGEERATLCVYCHGQDGNSKRDYIPNLASQNAEYLFVQFEMFANGQRKDFVMSRLAQGLTADDKIAVALFFSRQAVVPRESDFVNTEKGKQVYQQVCFVCHGDQGHGSAQYPRIAGQPYEFLEKTLIRFLKNEVERKDSIMASVIKNMSEQDLKEVAAYVSKMP